MKTSAEVMPAGTPHVVEPTFLNCRMHVPSASTDIVTFVALPTVLVQDPDDTVAAVAGVTPTATPPVTSKQATTVRRRMARL
jgi:hypothetical protein